jgi:hypothetical protein
MAFASIFALSLMLTAAETDYCQLLDEMQPTYKGQVPQGFLLNLTAPGEDPKFHPTADDQGPPWDIKQCMLAVTGANCGFPHVDWTESEPNPPDQNGNRTFNWEKLQGRLDNVPEGHYLTTGIGFGHGGSWMNQLKEENEAKWWELFEGFLTEAAKYIRQRRPFPEDIYYRSPGNEPSLTFRPDWADRHMQPVPHLYDAIKRAHPNNKLIVGALVVGRRGHINELYRAGLKDHFDVLDIHSYDDTGGKAHLSMDQIIETHQVLEEHGDGEKKIWLGEGWACFPLPDRIDRRERERYEKGLGMSTEPYEYSKEDIEHYRKTIIRGWYNLMTPRETYDPKWMLGASYFCLNDMWGSMGWKKRAIPHYDDQGNIEWWDLDGYHIPYEPFKMEPVYRPWGIIDAKGKPKGDIIMNVPPYLPKHKFAATPEGAGVQYPEHMDGDRLAAIPLKTLYEFIAGKPYTVTLTFVSEEDEPYRNCRFNMDTREDNNNDRHVQFRSLDDPNAGDLRRGQRVTKRFEVIFPPHLVGKELCIIGELEYIWAERIPYYASAWLNAKVLPAASQQFAGKALVSTDRDQPIEVSVKLTNETASIFSTIALPKAGPELIFEPRQHQVNLNPGESKEVTFKIRLAPNAPLGTYPFTIDTGSSLSSISEEVTFALPALDPATNEWGLLHNGGFEEAVGERGHQNWSGNMTDWDTGDALKGLERGGNRCLTYAANGVTPTKIISQTITWPGPDGKTGPLMASMWAKEVGFELTAKPSETRFQMRLVYLDSNGKELQRHQSEVFKGTGEWEHLTHRFPAPPPATRFIRFEIESTIERAAGWHLHHADRVKLTVE